MSEEHSNSARSDGLNASSKASFGKTVEEDGQLSLLDAIFNALFVRSSLVFFSHPHHVESRKDVNVFFFLPQVASVCMSS